MPYDPPPPHVYHSSSTSILRPNLQERFDADGYLINPDTLGPRSVFYIFDADHAQGTNSTQQHAKLLDTLSLISKHEQTFVLYFMGIDESRYLSPDVFEKQGMVKVSERSVENGLWSTMAAVNNTLEMWESGAGGLAVGAKARRTGISAGRLGETTPRSGGSGRLGAEAVRISQAGDVDHRTGFLELMWGSFQRVWGPTREGRVWS